MAAMRPPMLLPFPIPARHDGTYIAVAANEAPRSWAGIYGDTLQRQKGDK